MPASVTEFVEAARRLTPAEQREIFARLLPNPSAKNTKTIWQFLCFSENLRVLSYTPGQEQYIDNLRQLLLHGVFARLDCEDDGTYEIYGAERTYYVVMTPQREFVAILSSWSPDRPPREITLKEK
jgi:hypothetical protein